MSYSPGLTCQLDALPCLSAITGQIESGLTASEPDCISSLSEMSYRHSPKVNPYSLGTRGDTVSEPTELERELSGEGATSTQSPDDSSAGTAR